MKKWILTAGCIVQVCFSCPQDELAVWAPVTQSTVCKKKWEPGVIKIIVERDCLSCEQLIQRIRKSPTPKNKQKIEFLWIEPDPQKCFSKSLQLRARGNSFCVARDAITQSWEVDSTPLVFWLSGNKPRTQRGLPSPDSELPWNVQ